MWKYVLFQISLHTLGRLPVPLLYRIADAIGEACYFLLARQRRQVWANLRQVMGPDASQAQVRRAARQVFRNVARYYCDLVHMPRMNLEAFGRRRLHQYGWYENVVPALRTGRGIIMASAHFGNPELASQGILNGGVRVYVLTEPLQPARLSRLVDRLRSSVGHTFVPANLTNVKKALRILKAGGVVALMMDRDVQGPRARLPFCGKEALMPTGPIEMAMRTGAIVIPAFCHRRGLDEIDAYLEEPLEMVNTGNFQEDVRTNALRLLARFERHLRQDPGQWQVLEPIWDSEPVPVTEASESRSRSR